MTLSPAGSRLRLVAFDLDGTLVDSIGDIASSVNASLVERYGEPGRLPGDVVRGFVGGGARRLIERCLDALGPSVLGRAQDEEMDPVFERFLRIYGSRLVETTMMYPGMREALAAVSTRAKVAILTNKPGEMSRVILSRLGVDGLFIGVIGADDIKTRKPDPEGLLQLCARAEVDPHEAALVGDSAVDVRTAKNAGALAVGVLWGYDRDGVLRERPDVTLNHPAELARLGGVQ